MSDRERENDGRSLGEASRDDRTGARPRPNGGRDLRWSLIGAVALAGSFVGGALQPRAHAAPTAQTTEPVQIAHTKGSPSAPVTITEWGDYQ